ncbi:hypothetical protein NKR19_g6753 [Coniochaeta hoffmannii]|uniref:2EXR domain-containing protein n=1 Tax=Coniochaeta hoffmannii TaxID=91930 RepID=A0AA38RQR4_9PEZI|nr:hypothetical protein NKR19_g6753 [Coniochaeta hoffmannii]
MHYDHQHRAPLQVNNMSNKFNYFQKLPAEIRTMIWEYSLPESRVYEVLDAPNSTQKTPAQQGLMFANVHPEPPPALAAVCRESRYFVLHHYKPLTLGKTTKYVDLSRDILLLEPYLLIKRLHRTLNFMSQISLIRDHIRRLALGTSYGIYTGICHPVLNWKVSKTNVGKLLSSLAKFPKLKTLIFIVHQEFQFEFDFRFPHAGGSSFGTLTHNLPMSHHHPSALHSAANPFQPPFVSSLRNPAVPTLGPLPPPAPRAPLQQRPALPLPQPPIPHQPYSSSHNPHAPPPPPPFPPQTYTPLPPSAPPQPQPRPQLVHQAYRFKFDIEANINHTPRRPHLNELLYYPLDYNEDDDDDDNCWDSPLDDSEGEESEWCDPWPTNDDWRRFRRRFGRAMRGVVLQGLGGAGGGENAGRGGGGGGEEDGWCGGRGGGGNRVTNGSWEGGGRGQEEERGGGRDRERLGRGKICFPALKGASLLWRYTKGGYV